MIPCDVILTEADNEVGLEVLRSLSNAGLKVCICDKTDGGPAFRSELKTEFFKTFRSKDELNFIRQLRSIAEGTGAGMIIPIFSPEIIAGYRDWFPGIILPIDREENIRVLDNKVSACALAARLGIRQPRMYADIGQIRDYPVVFKRSGGHGGDSVYFPKVRASLEHLAANSEPGSYIISEELHGTEFSVDAIRWDGYFHAEAYEVLEPKARKGVSLVRRSVVAPELCDMLRTMLEDVDYRGVCGADFIVDRDGKAYFLECNPRFSGGLSSQIAAGFDMPRILWQLSHNEKPDAISFTPGIITTSEQYRKRQ